MEFFDQRYSGSFSRKIKALFKSVQDSRKSLFPKAEILQLAEGLLTLRYHTDIKQMNRLLKFLIAISLALVLFSPDTEAQSRRKRRPSPPENGQLQYTFIDGDVVYLDRLDASVITTKAPRKVSKMWRKYYKLVHNFSKTYPYALAAKKIVARADSTIATDNLKRVRKDVYINRVQDDLFEMFEDPLRNLTISQGALLMKLIDREIGKSSYFIIKDYKSGIAAKFWQGIAKVFGSDLKKPYDPEGEDKHVETLVSIWEDGEFPKLYFSIFGKNPPEVDIPSKYR